MAHSNSLTLHPHLVRNFARGFTIIELVTVIVLVGILAAVAAPRFMQNEVFDARTFTDQNMNMLRYAQKLAIAQSRPVFVLMSTSRIALCFSAACEASNRVLRRPAPIRGSRPPLPMRCGPQLVLRRQARQCHVWRAEGRLIFYFNALGRPFLSRILTLSNLQHDIPIGSSGTTRNVIVEAETGYVHSKHGATASTALP